MCQDDKHMILRIHVHNFPYGLPRLRLRRKCLLARREKRLPGAVPRMQGLKRRSGVAVNGAL